MARTVIVALCGLALTGCITYEETEYKGQDRAKVEFENDSAARVFYEALSKAPAAKSGTEVRSEVEIPVVFKHKKRIEQGPNSAFNRAVELCDTNKDGKITEMEAKIYAEMIEKR